MKESLFIHLGCAVDQCIDWLCWSVQLGEIVSSGELNHASELEHLQEMAMSRDVIILLPGQHVVLQQMELGVSHYRQVQHSLGYLFEEQLSVEPERLHVCRVDYRDGLLTAAIVDKSLMNQWILWLDEAGISSAKWIPDYLALPVPDEHQMTLLSWKENWLVRSSISFGAFIDDNWLALGIDKLDPEHDRIFLTNVQTKPLGDQREYTLLDVELPIQAMVEGALNTSVNLLQGEFRRERPVGRLLYQLRYLIASLVLAVILMGANQGVRLWRLHQQVHSGEQQLAALYEQVFHNKAPQSSYLVRESLKHVVEQRNRHQGQDGLLSMLSQLTPAFAKLHGLEYKSLRFDRSTKQLAIRIEAPSFSSFEQIKQAIHPLQMTTGALNRTGHKVVGTVTIKE